ncbi:hypothetical protein [Phenylobacterium sp.]|uniref:hypothetical protein n=1 Tax=Phenylobacterium sp. TaxID=1871053 RepID=UPI002CCB18DE|nr:hypothetical protein [Phenylobacterium sp.]HVI30656.1 hypothetical protein [Phenylobacterium sp.]
MPWVLKEPDGWRSRLRRRLRHWRYDHGPGLTALGIGAACATGALTVLKVAGLLG